MSKPPDVIFDIVPSHETSILAGASGSGKTTLLMCILLLMQQNKPVYGHAIRQDLKIGYLAADRTWDAYARLARQVGVDMSQMNVTSLVDDPEIDINLLEHDPTKVLYNILKKMVAEGTTFAIVDPLPYLLGCDMNTYHKVAARLIQLNRFCKVNGLTVLGTHHATKARTDQGFKRPQDRINGSGALLGFTSTQLFLASPEESGADTTNWHVISHHAPPKVIKLKRNAAGLFEEAHEMVNYGKEEMVVDEGTFVNIEGEEILA